MVTQNSVGEGEVLVTSKPGKRFRNAVPACVLLRKNVRNGVPTRSVTEVPLAITVLSFAI
jgi:hypothetical protein